MLPRRVLALAVVAVACRDSPTAPSPTYPQVAGTYRGPVTLTVLGSPVPVGTLAATVVQAGNQATITGRMTGEFNRTLPTITGTIGERGNFYIVSGGGSTGELVDHSTCGEIRPVSRILAFPLRDMAYAETWMSERCDLLLMEAARLIRQ